VYVLSLNGNSTGSATPLTPFVSGSTTTANATGIITRPGTAEFFRFCAAAGTASITGQVHSALPVRMVLT
jgi:hypothetical protein